MLYRTLPDVNLHSCFHFSQKLHKNNDILKNTVSHLLIHCQAILNVMKFKMDIFYLLKLYTSIYNAYGTQRKSALTF